MKKDTVRKLRKLNDDFYSEVGKYFDSTRDYAWKGWERLLEIGYFDLQQQGLSVLDLGCGNGRFAEFLKQSEVRFDYLGIDNSDVLLDSAKPRIGSKGIRFNNMNILDVLHLERSFRDKKYDLITLFGVMHHIPGDELRGHLLGFCRSHLKENGKLIFSIWDFMKDERFTNRLIDPEKAGFSDSELDKNDHILDWRGGKIAYRYCHYYTKDEIEELIRSRDLSIEKEFYADGRSGKLNRYYVTVPVD